jgi:hypothetical protein
MKIRKEKKEKIFVSHFLFFLCALRKKSPLPYFFSFFVSGSHQLQPDQPGLQRAQKN